jgi:hypothetical protein
MAKLTTDDLTQLATNEASAVSTINDNFAATETAMENTLSRDGTTPNTMATNIDMDGTYTFINVRDAVASDEPVTLGQTISLGVLYTGPSISSETVEVVASASDLNFGSGITVADDGDSTATITVVDQSDGRLIQSYTLTGDDQTLAFFSGSDTPDDYAEIEVIILNLTTDGVSTDTVSFQVRESGGSFLAGTNYRWHMFHRNDSGTNTSANSTGDSSMRFSPAELGSGSDSCYHTISLSSPGSARRKTVFFDGTTEQGSTSYRISGGGSITTTNEIDAIRLRADTDAITGGTVLIYGKRSS